MKTTNFSKQRKAIVDFLLTRKDHPTAEIIYSEVKKDYPNLSLGTVYRNLNLLTEMGTIRQLFAADDTSHYDADTSDHQHFICKSCGAVIDIFLDNEALLKKINNEAANAFKGTIEKNDIYFYGTCKNCETTEK